MNKILAVGKTVLRKLRLFFTPGVCCLHELKKNYYVARDLDACPDCFLAEVMANFGRSGIPVASANKQRLTEFEGKIAGLRVRVK